MPPKIVFVDVDDTLIRSVGAKRIPMPGVVAQVRQLKAEGVALYLWSSGGAEYARASAAELGLWLLPGFSAEADGVHRRPAAG